MHEAHRIGPLRPGATYPSAGGVSPYRHLEEGPMSVNRFRFSPPPPGPAPAGFVLFPVACLPAQAPEQGAWQLALYQKALEEAQAVVQPSLLERDLLAVWN